MSSFRYEAVCALCQLTSSVCERGTGCEPSALSARARADAHVFCSGKETRRLGRFGTRERRPRFSTFLSMSSVPRGRSRSRNPNLRDVDDRKELLGFHMRCASHRDQSVAFASDPDRSFGFIGGISSKKIGATGNLFPRGQSSKVSVSRIRS